MRICIPTHGDEGLRAEVAGHLGRAPFLTLIDTESGELAVIPNAPHQDGHCHPTASLEGRGVEAIVCSGVGRRAVAAIETAGHPRPDDAGEPWTRPSRRCARVPCGSSPSGGLRWPPRERRRALQPLNGREERPAEATPPGLRERARRGRSGYLPAVILTVRFSSRHTNASSSGVP